MIYLKIYLCATGEPKCTDIASLMEENGAPAGIAAVALAASVLADGMAWAASAAAETLKTGCAPGACWRRATCGSSRSRWSAKGRVTATKSSSSAQDRHRSGETPAP